MLVVIIPIVHVVKKIAMKIVKEMVAINVEIKCVLAYLIVKNVMGKILMACRDALRSGSEPQIDYALLREKRINLLGHLLTFEVAQAA